MDCPLPLRITAYFDGSHDGTKSQAFVLAGWTAWTVEWQSFETKWRSVLAAFGLSDFHMREYESGWGSFKGWDRDRKIQLLSQLIDVFEASAAPPSQGPVGFWSGMELPDYQRPSPESVNDVVLCFSI